MSTGNDYRAKPADMKAKALAETNQQIKSALEGLVLAYLRLAEHADTTSIYRTHPEHPVLQQQQSQLEK